MRRVSLQNFSYPQNHTQRLHLLGVLSSYGMVETLVILPRTGEVDIQFQNELHAHQFTEDFMVEFKEFLPQISSDSEIDLTRPSVSFEPPHKDLCSRDLFIWGDSLPHIKRTLHEVVSNELKIDQKDVEVHIKQGSNGSLLHNIPAVEKILYPILGPLPLNHGIFFGYLRLPSIEMATLLVKSLQRQWASQGVHPIHSLEIPFSSQKHLAGLMFIDQMPQIRSKH